MKTFLNKRLIRLIITLAISCLLDRGSIENAAAQVKPKPTLSQLLLPKLPPSNKKTATNSKIQFNRPAIPPGTAPGGRRTGGGRRDSCPAVSPKLTALVPVTQGLPNIQNVWGLTTVERPIFWFYVPYTKTHSYLAEFVLQDQGSKPIYIKNVALPEKVGIISVAIPKSVPALLYGQEYRWFLKVYCDQTKQSPPVYVEGVVRRVNLSQSVNRRLGTARSEQEAAIYAENGIWFQALAILAELQINNPQDVGVQATWKSLLADVGLSEIADKPIRE